VQLHYPSACAEKLINDEVDLALVPIAVIPNLKEYYIISEYCIGADGPVDTVCLYSDVPISSVESIFLDYQSLTSVELLKILLREYWDLSPQLIKSDVGFESNIKDKQAGLVIGDRAFHLNSKYKYKYDLSKIWQEMTGLSFVFAVWVSNKKLSKKFIQFFNKSIANGIQNIHKALKIESPNYIKFKNNADYLNNKISYNFDSKKVKGMNLFLKKIISSS
jgi:chorismate dehydratase